MLKSSGVSDDFVVFFADRALAEKLSAKALRIAIDIFKGVTPPCDIRRLSCQKGQPNLYWEVRRGLPVEFQIPRREGRTTLTFPGFQAGKVIHGGRLETGI